MTSLLIPHRNRSVLIAETLRSLEEQTSADWEAIVVDHGSDAREQEAVAQVVARHSRARLLTRTTGPDGPSASRNLALREATGDYVIFLDSDDLLAPRCLETRRSHADAEPDADLWVFPAQLFRERPGDMETRWNRMATGEEDLIRFLRSDGPWCVSSPLWRREVIASLGGFDEAVIYGDDLELHLRAILTGLRARQYPDERPDIHVRRSDAPRITQGSRPELIASRIVRLERITALLRKHAVPERRPDAWRTWEGQFVQEAEHLLFHYPRPTASPAIRQVLALWQDHFAPGRWRRSVLKAYLHLALAARERAYLILRLARRAAKGLLPREYFVALVLGVSAW